MTAAAPPLELADVDRRFGRRVALAGITLRIDAGELVAVVGGNGAGKSTLLRVIAGFLDADRGAVRVGGVDVAAAPARAARGRGYLVEGAPLPPELAVGEYLRWRARLRGVTIDVAAALAEVGLAERRADPIGTLSKGQRQRVAWVEAHLGDPPLILLDEPASGLDEAERAAVRGRLAAGRGRRAVVWASHELADVEAIADRVVILDQGRLRAVGTLAAIRADLAVPADTPLRELVAPGGA